MSMRKHYAVFFSPGTLIAESSFREVPSWDPAIAAKLAQGIVERYDATPYAFRFETQIEHDPVPDGEGGMLKVQPRTITKSGLYFLGGTLVTLDDVERRNDPKESILRFNMRENSVVVCENRENRFRSTIPFEEDDVLCDRDGRIIDRGDSADWKAYRARKAKELAEREP
jgi:hypothetical protein